MNTVLSNYGQLCGCPEILKKSCKFFCRGLDIRVTNIVQAYSFHSRSLDTSDNLMFHIGFCKTEHSFICHNSVQM